MRVVLVVSSATNGPLMARTKKMQVGDLVGTINNSETHLALVIHVDKYETLIRWIDDGTVEDANNYATSLEVFSESR